MISHTARGSGKSWNLNGRTTGNGQRSVSATFPAASRCPAGNYPGIRRGWSVRNWRPAGPRSGEHETKTGGTFVSMARSELGTDAPGTSCLCRRTECPEMFVFRKKQFTINFFDKESLQTDVCSLFPFHDGAMKQVHVRAAHR